MARSWKVMLDVFTLHHLSVNQSQYNVCWPMHTSCLFTNTNKKWCPQTQ